MAAVEKTAIYCYIVNGFEPIRDAFRENFRRRKELGAACCVYRHGEKVVDLWGGIRNNATGEPWEENTMFIVHSAELNRRQVAPGTDHRKSVIALPFEPIGKRSLCQ